jgi:hypothetical protein
MDEFREDVLLHACYDVNNDSKGNRPSIWLIWRNVPVIREYVVDEKNGQQRGNLPECHIGDAGCNAGSSAARNERV